MKKLFTTMSLGLLFCFAAQAEVVNVNVCGKHTLSIDGRHYIVAENSADLADGQYEVFATGEFSADLLDSLSTDTPYCIKGGFNRARPDEGISLISVD